MAGKMTIEGVDVGKVKSFPFSALKTLGSIQIGIGSICICVGLVDFLMFIFFEDEFISDAKIKQTEDYDKVDTLTKTFTPVWCGVWFCVTGAFAAIMTQKKIANITYYKMTFLILSITCAGISGPLCFIVSVTSAYLRHGLTPQGFRWLVPLLIAFFSFCEIVFAIVSSAVCCCCAPFDSSRVRVVLAKHHDNDQFHAIVKTEKSGDSLDIFTTADKEGKPLPRKREEIKPAKDVPKPPVEKDDRRQKQIKKENKKPTPIREERQEEKTPPPPPKEESRRSRKPERKPSIEKDDNRHDFGDDFDDNTFGDEPLRTRGYNNRPYTKDSSYEQLKSLAIPKTAPKQTF